MKHGYRFVMLALVVAALAAALVLIVAGSQGALAQAGGIIYVDADAGGVNNGSSWRHAHTDLQDALDEAEPLDQIWVAAGTYKPSRQIIDDDPRSATFQMVNGVAIYGGFDPGLGVTKFEDRDWVAHKTILSGDIGIEGDPADNVYHVFYHPLELALDGSAILDGFAITAGNADEPDYPGGDCGGGLYNDHSLPTLNNVTFVDNWAGSGGGLYVSRPLTITEPVTLTNLSFEGNSAVDGGAVYIDAAQHSPGDDIEIAFANCIFWGNDADRGGGLFITGGELDTETGSIRLTNCIFWGNQAENEGGGLFITWGEPDADESFPLHLTNCTFSGNSADDHGGAIWVSADPSEEQFVTNSILWGDTAGGLPNEIYAEDPEHPPLVTFSNVQGGYEGDGNIEEDPAFVDPDGGDLHLLPGSVCIDSANNGPDLAQYDIDGDLRILDGDGDGWAVVDMGADEFKMPTIWVEIDVTPSVPSNVIKLGSPRRVPVAILTTGEFDAVAEVAPDTVRFAGATHVGFRFVDVDEDGHEDVLLDFRARDMVDLDEGSTEATLTGETLDADPFEGQDEVRVIP